MSKKIKMKSNRGAAKRFKLRPGGTIKNKRAFHSHILTKKTTKRCRNLRKRATIGSANQEHVERMLLVKS